ncbi:hypothetical protein uav_002 [Pseudomonas phage UAVern]|uniref:Uncharacterized protein n=1 Tax=Pseudomonas phage UAVern TaxID=2856997 RepID=A0A975UWY7_9CAUD|nr:hypothetical protein uav_002 [Pseudomonas phage UAVern]
MYALILTLCSFASCNGYVIATDTEWNTPQQCDVELVRESDDFAQVWGQSLKGMHKYLDRFNVQEDVQTLVDYDYTCEKIAQDDMP